MFAQDLPSEILFDDAGASRTFWLALKATLPPLPPRSPVPVSVRAARGPFVTGTGAQETDALALPDTSGAASSKAAAAAAEAKRCMQLVRAAVG